MASQAGKNVIKKSGAILKFLTRAKTNFDRIGSSLEVVSAAPGELQTKFTVSEEHLNGHGSLHGGYTAYLVDLVTTMALMTSTPDTHPPGVSVDLSVSYMRAAMPGDVITVDAVTLRRGRTLSFSSIDFRNPAGQLIAQGKHTKAFRPEDAEVWKQIKYDE